MNAHLSVHVPDGHGTRPGSAIPGAFCYLGSAEGTSMGAALDVLFEEGEPSGFRDEGKVILQEMHLLDQLAVRASVPSLYAFDRAASLEQGREDEPDPEEYFALLDAHPGDWHDPNDALRTVKALLGALPPTGWTRFTAEEVTHALETLRSVLQQAAARGTRFAFDVEH